MSEKYSPNRGKSEIEEIFIFCKNKLVVMYKCGLPGISKVPDFSINPRDSSVFSDDSDSTPLISETLSFVTGCSYATIDNVSKAGVDRPLKIEGGLNSANSDEIVLSVAKSEELSSYFI